MLVRAGYTISSILIFLKSLASMLIFEGLAAGLLVFICNRIDAALTGFFDFLARLPMRSLILCGWCWEHPRPDSIRSYFVSLQYIWNDYQGQVSNSGDNMVAESKSILCSFVVLILFYKQTPVFVLYCSFVTSNDAINVLFVQPEEVLRQADGSQ